MNTILKEFKAGKLTGNTIKLIGIICMIIDHIGWIFYAENSIIGIMCHVVGRVTAPVMCYFIAEGNHYTKNKRKYINRLFIFAVISQIPFSLLVNGGQIKIIPLNMIFTLIFGLAALIVYKEIKNAAVKYLCIVLICVVSVFSDWSFYGVFMVLCFGIFRGNFRYQITSYISICYLKIIDTLITSGGFSLYKTLPQTLSVILVLLLLRLYSGKRGGKKYSKWFFYIIYPLHMLIIYLVSLFLN